MLGCGDQNENRKGNADGSVIVYVCGDNTSSDLLGSSTEGSMFSEQVLKRGFFFHH